MDFIFSMRSSSVVVSGWKVEFNVYCTTSATLVTNISLPVSNCRSTTCLPQQQWLELYRFIFRFEVANAAYVVGKGAKWLMSMITEVVDHLKLQNWGRSLNNRPF